MIKEYLFNKLVKYLGLDVKTVFQQTGNYAGATNVDNDTIMGIPAIYAAIRLVSNTIASLPLHIIQKTPNGDRQRLDDHRLNYLFSPTGEGPNLYQSWFEFVSLMQTRLMLYQNAYAFIGKMKGVPGGISLLPVNPAGVQVNPNERTGEITYDFTWATGEQVKKVPYSKMFHLRGYTKDGFKGVPLIESQLQSLALNVSMERALQSFWGNSARTAGYFSTDEPLQQNELASIQKKFAQMAGPQNAGKSLFVPNNVKFHSIAASLKDSESSIARRFQLHETSRTLGVQPHKLGDLDRSNFSNIESENISFLQQTVGPYTVMWRQKLKKTLLLPEEREKGEFFYHDNSAFLQTTTREESEALSLAVGGTWMTQNEARERLDMNRIQDPSADELLAQPGSTDAAVTKEGTGKDD